ncbi:3-oxoacyl-ACP synthase III family protein [Streptomyces sp. NPDC005863]|uniref:3-oxoacyl-ACP synthase III family protein n=1 Tax=unclassified Streptomyces TaxID=2593676 RepID=UPI0033CC2849
MPETRALLEGIAVHLPDRYVPAVEIEGLVNRSSPGFRPPPGLISQLTGVKGVHVLDADQQASDLAAAAASQVLDETGTGPEDIDLLIFASSSQDMIEPATGHIVSAKLGLRCPVFDLKNACNSILNAIEVTQALITSSQYSRVLVVTGEAPSRSVRWSVPDAASFARSFASYGFSDAGGAVLWTSAATSSVGQRGVLATEFAARSDVWECATIPTGGTVHPRGADEHAYFSMNGTAMREAFRGLGSHRWKALEALGLTWADFDFVALHQVAVADVEEVCERLGLAREQVLVTVADHGNVASASLLLQLAKASSSGRIKAGDLVALIGLAAGASAGLGVVRL